MTQPWEISQGGDLGGSTTKEGMQDLMGKSNGLLSPNEIAEAQERIDNLANRSSIGNFGPSEEDVAFISDYVKSSIDRAGLTGEKAAAADRLRDLITSSGENPYRNLTPQQWAELRDKLAIINAK